MLINYNVDIAFCIDRSAEMAPFISSLKEFLDNFLSAFVSRSNDWGFTVDFRVKFILFGDYAQDGENAMRETAFFSLEDGVEPIHELLDTIRPLNSTGPSKNGLEAISKAIMSDWVTNRRSRKIIVLMSGSDAFDLGERADSSAYPTDLPKNMSEFVDLWEQFEPYNGHIRCDKKRLALLAPHDTNYTVLNEILAGVSFEPIDFSSAENMPSYAGQIAERIFLECYAS